MTYVPDMTEQDSMRFHRIIQNSMKFKTYEFLISENLHLIFPDLGV